MANPIMSVTTPANYSSFEVESGRSREQEEPAGTNSRPWKKAKILALAVATVACVVMVGAFLSTSSSRAHHLGLAQNIIRRWHCARGSYPNGRSQSGSCVCAKCPRGWFCVGGFHPRRQCPPGRYQPHAGQVGCVAASRGHFVHHSGSWRQYPCPRGTFQPHGGRRGCANSPPGHYVPGTGAWQAKRCHPGSFQPHARRANCHACPPGWFQPHWAQRGCARAHPGHYVPRHGSRTQAKCPPGTFQPHRGQRHCYNCERGHFCPHWGMRGQAACHPGWFQPRVRQRGCHPAAKNHYVPHSGWTRQLRCPHGWYQPRRAQRGCIRLPSRRIRLGPVYRYWNARIGDHFYTMNFHELGRGRHGWRSEGVACWMSPRAARGLVPLYRYWNSHNTDHFYTTNIHEIGTAHPGRVGRHGYKSEGVLGYCSPRHVRGSIPFYRYWNPHNSNHFYTTNIHEIGTAHPGRVGRHGYRSEGVVCWVWNKHVAILPPVAMKKEDEVEGKMEEKKTETVPQEVDDVEKEAEEVPVKQTGETKGEEVEGDDEGDGKEVVKEKDVKTSSVGEKKDEEDLKEQVKVVVIDNDKKKKQEADVDVGEKK